MKIGDFRPWRAAGLGAAAMVLAAAAATGGLLARHFAAGPGGIAASAFADADNPGMVARGSALYASHCARCHGSNLEGQPNWHEPGANGRFPAPPQDQRGHSWMHSDAELIHRIKASIYDEAPPGYESDMPAFADALTDDEVTAILAFVKSRWALGVRVYQASLNPGRQGLPKDAGAADWSLPIDCGSEPDRALGVTSRVPAKRNP